jgi:hypothetical protein
VNVEHGGGSKKSRSTRSSHDLIPHPSRHQNIFNDSLTAAADDDDDDDDDDVSDHHRDNTSTPNLPLYPLFNFAPPG